MLLLEAWGLCVTNADRISLVQTVENFVNTGAFGTEESHSQWKVPINKDLIHSLESTKNLCTVNYFCPTTAT